jgi:hypothetical protein
MATTPARRVRSGKCPEAEPPNSKRNMTVSSTRGGFPRAASPDIDNLGGAIR